VRYNNDVSTVQTMPYSHPLTLPANSVQNECPVRRDRHLIPNSNKMENTDFPIPYVDFDDDIYLKSIRDNKAEVKMQINPSYHGTTIPYIESTTV